MDKPERQRAFAPRGTWTPERRAKFQATRARQNAENMKKYGTAAAPESIAKLNQTRAEKMTERRDNSKARAYLPELMHLVLTVMRAIESPAVFEKLADTHPELRIRWDRHHQHILLTFSTNSLRPRYGILAEQMFRRLFQCYQPGGFSTETKAGYKSVWRLNMAALDAWLIASQSKRFTVSAAFKALMHITEDRRGATEYELVDSKERDGLKELVGREKKMMTPAERKAVLEHRRELVAAMKEHNERQMADWKKTG